MFFIDTDLITNIVYVIPFRQIPGREYVIACQDRYSADRVRGRLIKGDLRSPINNEEQFEVKEYVDKFGKSLTVYKLKEE